MNLSRKPLTQAESLVLDHVKWRAVTRAQAQDVAEFWNAGAGADKVAAAVGLSRGSTCMLLGRLRQLGLDLRLAPTAAAPGSPHPERPTISAQQRARLERLAEHDAVARRALALLTGSP